MFYLFMSVYLADYLLHTMIHQLSSYYCYQFGLIKLIISIKFDFIITVLLFNFNGTLCIFIISYFVLIGQSTTSAQLHQVVSCFHDNLNVVLLLKLHIIIYQAKISIADTHHFLLQVSFLRTHLGFGRIMSRRVVNCNLTYISILLPLSLKTC